MDYTHWFAHRLAQLREEKGVSAQDMSLSLGQSESYINKIENRRSMPSMPVFFYICDYLQVTPRDFFDDGMVSPTKTQRLAQALGKLPPEQAEHILQLVRDLTE